MLQPALTDQSPMPFGKHKDDPMEAVPAGYLLWLWDNGLHRKTGVCPVAQYIEENWNALTKEASDYLPKNPPR